GGDSHSSATSRHGSTQRLVGVHIHGCGVWIIGDVAALEIHADGIAAGFAAHSVLVSRRQTQLCCGVSLCPGTSEFTNQRVSIDVCGRYHYACVKELVNKLCSLGIRTAHGHAQDWTKDVNNGGKNSSGFFIAGNS